MLVAIRARLQHEDDLVDPGLLVARDQVLDLRGRADRAAQRPEPLLQEPDAEGRLVRADDVAREAGLSAALLEFVPHVGDAGGVWR